MEKKKIPLISRLFPEEFFGLIMLTALIIISIIFNKHIYYNRITGRHYFHFFSYTVLIFIIFGGKFKSITKIIRNFFPLVLITTVFENLGDVVTKINPHFADKTLIAIDKFIFGGDPSIWMQRFYTPWLSNLMHSAYTSYYFLPPMLGMILYISGKYKEFRDFVVAATFTAFIGYIGYVLVPAVGPRYTLAHLYTKDIKTGAVITKVIKMINNYEPFRADCFPSLHTAHTFIVMIFSARYLSKFISIPVNILGTLLIISTMYGRYHYGIDVIAGLLLATFNIYIAPYVNNWWYKKIFIGNWKEHYPGKLKFDLKKIYKFFTNTKSYLKKKSNL